MARIARQRWNRTKGHCSVLDSRLCQTSANHHAGELKDFTPAKRYTLLLCLIHRTKARARDAVAGTLVKRISTIHKRAKNELMERQLEQRERVDRLLGRL